MSTSTPSTTDPQPGTGPPSRPEREALRRFREDPLAFVLEQQHEQGDAPVVILGRLRTYILGHPEHFREVLVTKKQSFEKGVVFGGLRLILGEGILTSEGELHDRQRRLVQPAFQHRRLLSHASRVAGEASARWTDWMPGQRLDVLSEMRELTREILAQTILDADIEGHRKDAQQHLGVLIELFGRAAGPFAQLMGQIPSERNRQIQEMRAALESMVDTLIDQRRRTGTEGRSDLLSCLLDAADTLENPVADRQIRDEILTVLVAGQDSVSNMLTWAWYALGRNPEARARLHAEIDEVLSGRLPRDTDLPHLPYTQAVITETLRMYPVAWIFSRTAVEDAQLTGVDVPKGSEVLLSPYLLHHDERWFPQAEAFLPERWLPGAPPPGHPFAYLPFGAGSRVCVGQGLANLAGAIALATIAQRWDLVSVGEVGLDSKSLLRPSETMTMIAEPRGTR